jgi:hypothetical protein
VHECFPLAKISLQTYYPLVQASRLVTTNPSARFLLSSTSTFLLLSFKFLPTPTFSIQTPVLYRLFKVLRSNDFAAGKVGYGELSSAKGERRLKTA